MDDKSKIQDIAQLLQVSATGLNFETAKRLIAEKINELLENDFTRLVSVLYRLDVSEIKLKQLLKENKDRDAGDIIAELMIQRQEEKIKTRNSFKQQPPEKDEEAW